MQNKKQYFDEYVFVAPGSDYGRAMWSDIARMDNAVLLDAPLRKTNRFISLLHHAHFSFAINRKVQLPFQQIWKRLYATEQLQWDASKRYCVIYTDVSAARTDHRYLRALRQRGNITMALVMVNTMARRGSLIESRRDCFDYAFTFDRKDAENYGMIYHPSSYSMVAMEPDGEITEDAFYVGVSKGRAKLLAQIYDRLTKGGAAASFTINGMKRGEARCPGIRYNEWMEYSDVLRHIRACNCIVEVMDAAQEGVTLRTMEAICYNKKLLTNNPAMRESRYYSTGFIQVFEKPEDIDVDFVRRKEAVNYGYDGEFSPVRLIERIEEIVERDRLTVE
ncbi:MAG: hypothetical protein IJ074_01385 [Clostridia bacterium]|nr:hypothetical protein [Clostridia bacterium]